MFSMNERESGFTGVAGVPSVSFTTGILPTTTTLLLPGSLLLPLSGDITG
jgi:hypothetical protein